MSYAPSLNFDTCIPEGDINATVKRCITTDFYRTRIPVHEDTIKTLMALRYLVNKQEVLDCYGSANTMSNLLGLTIVCTRTIKNYRTDADPIRTAKDVVSVFSTPSKNLVMTLLNTYGATPEELTELEKQLNIAGYYLRDDYSTAIVASVNNKATLWQLSATETTRARYVLLSNMCSTDNIVKLIGAAYSIEKKLPVEVIEDILTLRLQHIKEYADSVAKEFESTKELRVRRQTLTQLSEVPIDTSTEQLERNIASAESNLRDKERSVQLYYKQLAEYKTKLFVAMNAPQQTYKELADYLKIVDVKTLTEIRIYDQKLIFTIKAPLLFWEEQPIKDMLTSRRSNTITDGTQYAQQMIKDIFVDKTVTLMTELHAYLHLNKSNIDDHCVVRHKQRDRDLEHYEYIAHPHIYFYNCWGDNAPIIDKAYYNFQFDIMFAQIQSVANSINTSDIAVINKLVAMLYGGYSVHNKPSLRINATGEMISPNDYMAHLKAEAEKPVTVKVKEATPLTMVEPGAPNTPVLNDDAPF